MITPNQIKEIASKWWDDKSFFKSWLNEESFFPKEVKRIGLVKANEVLSNFSKIVEEQEALVNSSKNKIGYGYQIEWEEINNLRVGKNKFISKIYFENELDFLKYLGKEKLFESFKNDVSFIKSAFPQLHEWILNNPHKIISNSKLWPDLLKVCNYFLTNPKPNLYIREIPLKISSKFIEVNKVIICELLDILLEEECINSDFLGNKNFEKRFGLKYDVGLKDWIRIRILDSNKHLNSNISHLHIIPFEFANLNFDCEKIFITENKMNLLTLPIMNSSIGIFGKGFNVSLLQNVDWVKGKEIYYWGDIDTHGFQILSQIRSYYPNTKSIMMDKKTLDSFKEFWGEGEETFSSNLPHLTSEELELFNFLKKNNTRLEQEKISQEYVLSTFKNLNLLD